MNGKEIPEDLAPSYAEETDESRLAAESAEMTSWLRRRAPEPAAEPPRPRPAGPPAAPSAAGNVMRSVAEIPRQAFGGVEDAVANATSILNPLTDWLNENVADLRIDRVPAPKTTTGRVTRSLSQFLTGFIPALKGMKALGVTNAAASSVGASAIADFLVRDPHEARLSNLWKEAGLPPNILTDYLASDPNDSDTEGRFKSAAESVITGVALEGLLHGARAIRAMKGASKALGADQAAQAELAAMKAQYGELTEQVSRKVFGDVKRPRLEVVSKKVQKAVEATKGMTPDDLIGGRGVVDAGDMSIFVNFRRINAPDDVKAVIADMAEKFSGTIKESQRGTITLKETEALADDLGMTVGELMARRQGQALNAEQLVAARKLWVSSAEHLLQLAQRAADPNAGAIDQFAFRQMLATHHAIQSEVMGARAEAARALGSWRLPVGGAIEQAMQMKDLVEASGGATLTQDLAKRLVILASVGGRGAVAKFVEKGAWATSVDALREVWINGLLSSPSTHIVNSLSNTANLAQQMVERNVAARIGELRGVQNVAPGEASAMAFGVIQSVRDAFRLAAKAFRSGEQTALGKIDLPREPAISAQAFRMSDGMMGRFVDLIGHAARIPGRFLMAEDEFFKTIGYRMELNANAVRQATSEGLRGPAFTARVANLIAHPPENLRIAATDGALYSTFNQAPGKIGHSIMRLREAAPASTLVMPFVRTPVNIARYTFERSPFAPLVGQWRADIAAGGARADIALARMSTGTAIMLTAMDMADSGMISGRGPVDPGERQAWERQGNQQYSRKVGDKWVSYNRADPYGALFGFAADVAEIVRRGELQEDDVDEWNEVVAMGIAAVSQVALNKTYLRGMSELVSAMADPTRKADRELTSIFTSFLPATALMGAVERAVDPTVRETNSPWEAIQARVAFLSSRLPPRRDLWGREVRAESGLGATYDMFTPAQTRTMRPEPIDVEIERLAPEAAGDNQPGSAPTKIGKRSSFMGVMVNFKEFPEVYDTYVRLAGNELHHPAFGKGAKDLLNDIVTGQSPLSKTYAMRSPPMRLLFINHVIGQYRALAQQAIMQDHQFRDFANHVERIRAEKMQQRMPVLQ